MPDYKPIDRAFGFGRPPKLHSVSEPTWCHVPSCGLPATHLGPKKLTYCAIHQKNFINPCTPLDVTCHKKGCHKHALFGYTKPEFCVAHRDCNMINLYYPSCDTLDCYVEASHGYTVPIRCYLHATSDMIRIRGTKCQNCDRLAIYGHGRPDFCHNHRTLTMTSYKWRACKHISCPRLATWASPGTQYASVCEDHRIESMVCVPIIKCRIPSCCRPASHKCGDILIYCDHHKFKP